MSITFKNFLLEKANLGVDFEKRLLRNMGSLVAGTKSDPQAVAALHALELTDPSLKLKNISSIKPRIGSTRRGKVDASASGQIIGDGVVTLKNGEKKYISVKSKTGNTVGQFGLAKAFNDDGTINTDTPEWKSWLQPFGLDTKKITAGLQASVREDAGLPWPTQQQVKIKIPKNHPIYLAMEKMWGSGYYYLRELNDGSFTAFKIDKNFIDNELLKNLRVTQINYPNRERKQITIYLQSDMMKFKLEVRNSRGAGSARPTQIQLRILTGP
jgi:hypothetical protein